MNTDEFLGQLASIFQEASPPIALQERVQELPGWDSLTFLELIALVDEQYGVTLSPGAIGPQTTVADLLQLITDGGSRRIAA